MTRTLPFIVLAISLLLHHCCPLTSVHPLSSTTDMTYDDRLQGIWRLKTEQDDVVCFHIGKTKDGKTQITSIEHKENGELDIATFVMFPTEISKNTYMRLKVEDISDQSLKDATGYFLLRYVFRDNNEFFVYRMQNEIIAEGIMSGKLKGEITYRPAVSNKKSARESKKVVDCVQITDATENIVKYIKTIDTNRLFPEKHKMVLQNVSD
ncbi:MAG: hypothetical protein JSV60_00150 [Desulfobacterales bacterium]|nr:MAG: hypothetical protein JSV60_00150 [Desulfobacterales bacterium]